MNHGFNKMPLQLDSLTHELLGSGASLPPRPVEVGAVRDSLAQRLQVLLQPRVLHLQLLKLQTTTRVCWFEAGRFSVTATWSVCVPPHFDRVENFLLSVGEAGGVVCSVGTEAVQLATQLSLLALQKFDAVLQPRHDHHFAVLQRNLRREIHSKTIFKEVKLMLKVLMPFLQPLELLDPVRALESAVAERGTSQQVRD